MRSSNVLKKCSWFIIVFLLGLAACAPVQLPAQDGPTSAPDQPQATQSPADPAAAPLEATPLTPDSPSSAPHPLATVAPTEAPVLGETPVEVMEQIAADLEQRAGIQRAALSVIRSEAVTWNDGSLGCPQPGVFYTQATIDGYWVVVQVGGVTYDYRVGRGNLVVLCEQPQPAGGLYSDIPATAVLIVPGQGFPSVTPVQP